MTLAPVNQYGGLYSAKKSKQDTPPLADIIIDLSTQPVKWLLKITRPGGDNLQVAEVEGVLLVVGYESE